MESMYRVHKINPVGVGKGEVPPLKNYLWKITYRLNLSRILWERLFPLFPELAGKSLLYLYLVESLRFDLAQVSPVRDLNFRRSPKGAHQS